MPGNVGNGEAGVGDACEYEEEVADTVEEDEG